MQEKISTQIQEAIYRAEVSKIFLEQGWMVYTPEADIGGVDFLVMNLKTEEVRKIQLKGRWTVDKKYQNKNIWMCFSVKNQWYICQHDIMVEIGLKCGLSLWEQKNGEVRNAYSVEPMSKKMAQMMLPYKFLSRLEILNNALIEGEESGIADYSLKELIEELDQET